MRIALVCPYAWDDPGGVQVHIRDLARSLLDLGHRVTVLAPVRRIAEEPFVVPVGRPVDIPYNAANAPIDPRPWSRRRVREALGGFGPDIVHVHEPFTPSTSLWATLEARVPVVATFHSGATRSRLADLAAPVLRRLARRLAARIAVSEAAAAFVRPRIDEGPGIEIIPPFIDVTRFASATPASIPGGGPRLLFIGRLDRRKGFPVAVDAFARLADDRPSLRLIVVGDGPGRGATNALPPHLRERVVMLGRVPNDRLPKVAAAADLYLGPAIGGESFGIVLVEAMAAGLPVVASDVPGYNAVIRDGLDGLLVPPGDPAALATAAARILDDEALAARLRVAGLERARGFDRSVGTARVEAIYARVRDGSGAAPRPRSLP